MLINKISNLFEAGKYVISPKGMPMAEFTIYNFQFLISGF